MRAIGKFQPRRKHLLLVLIAPVVLWVLMVELMPTRWLCRRLESSVERLTGLPTKVDRMKLTLLGGVKLDGVHVGPIPSSQDIASQIHVRKVVVDADWGSILFGQLAITDLALIGVEGTLTRSTDGMWLPKRWLRPMKNLDQTSRSLSDRSWLVDVEIRGGSLEINDPSHKSKILITGLMGVAEAGEDYFKMPQLLGRVEGGEMALAISADRAQEIPIFDGNLEMRNIPLGVHFDVLGFICPLLAGETATPKGRLDLELYLQGRLEPDWQESLKGNGLLKLDPVSVVGLPLVERLGLDTLVAEINGNKHKMEDLTLKISNPFTIKSRRVVSPALHVNVGPVPIRLEGWTDFDGQLDYAIRTDAIREQLPKGMRGVLDDLNPQEEALAIRGSLNALTILVNDQPLTTERYRIRKTDLRNQMEQISRRLSERLTR